MKLLIPAHIEQRLNAYVHGVDGEIAGMGKVEKRGDGNLYLVDIAIYEQEVTGGTADLSTEALAKFLTELVQRGESPKDWYLWWHSHNNFPAYFSGTDTGTIESSVEFDHVVSLVVNKRRERQCRLDTHRPFRLALRDVPVEILPAPMSAKAIAIEEDIKKLMDELAAERDGIVDLGAIKEEIEAKVKQKKYGYLTAYDSKKSEDKWWERNEEDPSWSKKRKKDGGVTVTSTNGDKFDRDELEILIDDCVQKMKAHVANGNADSFEYQELREDLRVAKSLLARLEVLEEEAEEEEEANAYSDGPRRFKWDNDLNDFVPIEEN